MPASKPPGTCEDRHCPIQYDLSAWAQGSEDIVMKSLRQPRISEQNAPDYSEQYLLDRLIAAGVGSLENWRALSPRARRNIFGITVAMARAIDGMAKRATAS